MPRAIAAVGAEALARLTRFEKAAITSVAYNYGRVPDPVVAAARTGNAETIGDAIRALASDNAGINARRRAAEADTARMREPSAPPSVTIKPTQRPPANTQIHISNNTGGNAVVTASQLAGSI
jgi:hypothetical protein